MIEWPVETLVQAGITEIMIISGEESVGDFARLLGDGSRYGCSFTYKIQKGAGGIPVALALAEQFANYDSVAVMLGDNILFGNIGASAADFSIPKLYEQSRGFFYECRPDRWHDPDPKNFGVATFVGSEIVGVAEKPELPPSRFVQIGIYFYTYDVFEMIKKLKPSKRGELEVTDLTNWYLNAHRFTSNIVEGPWTDAGTHRSYLVANRLAAERVLL